MSGESATRLRAKYSTASAKSVEKFVAKRYALPGPVECALLHRGFNDSFEVKAADGQRYVLRLSCRRPRGEADVASETAFLTYLDSADVPVAAPLQTRDGARFAYGLLPEGRRPVVLFRYAEGAAPRPWASDHAKAQGITLARIHNAADAYRNRDDCAFRLDLNHLLNRQVHSTLTVAGLTTETQTNLTELASRLSECPPPAG